ncbi:MAG: hypothetical protein ACUVX9_00120 [Anaerolineae bacterium]
MQELLIPLLPYLPQDLSRRREFAPVQIGLGLGTGLVDQRSPILLAPLRSQQAFVFAHGENNNVGRRLAQR